MSDEQTVQASNGGPRGAAVVSAPNPEVVPKVVGPVMQKHRAAHKPSGGTGGWRHGVVPDLVACLRIC